MARALSELVLEWQRIIPVPGESAIWNKFGYTDIMPGTVAFFGFQSHTKIGVVIDQLDFFPVDPVSMAVCTPMVTINNEPYMPERSIFTPPDTALVLQVEHPTMIRVAPNRPFAFQITNNSPVFAAGWYVSARIFTERIPN